MAGGPSSPITVIYTTLLTSGLGSLGNVTHHIQLSLIGEFVLFPWMLVRDVSKVGTLGN